MDQCRCFRHQSLTAATARAKRLLAVTCLDHVLAVPRPSPDMGQAEEVEAGAIRLRMACALCHLRAEIDEACLVGMEREPKPRKTLPQDRQHAFGVDDIVERHDRIVGEPGKGAFRCRSPNKVAWPRVRSAKCGAPGEPSGPGGSRRNRARSLARRPPPAPS